MSNVRTISSSILQAENQQESSRIELTPWDLLILPLYQIQKGLLFQKPTPDLQETLIHHLKVSLAKTLDYFPPLAGRLATVDHEEDDSVSYFIDCNNAGALFIHAAADSVSISDIIKPVYVPQNIVHSFFPLNGLKNYEGVSNPLLGIQVTDLADGIFIGCTMNHSVADGSSFWHFLNLWSEISRGSIPLSKLPVFQRWLPDVTDFPIRIPKSHLKQVIAQEQPNVAPPLETRVFHFTRENIAKLKAKANAEVGTNNNISSLQALLCHTWRSVLRNRNINGNEMTFYGVVIGTRQRLPELPESYFGNAMQGTLVTMKAKEVLEEGIGKAALQMNRAIAAMTEQRLKSLLVSWAASPWMVTMSSMTNRNKGLVTSSSPRFNVYGNDFGWGEPIAVRSGTDSKFEGQTTLFCGAEEGSIDIEACLPQETLEALGNDEEFIDNVAFQ